ncbi:uncharacterized protein Z520_05505 [Fonsecaea multimorphosa CBS 102226]|uniref:TAP-C domain-containing protein n=1 Tax=Fonsecaea multimorphosa CBS 102226 TaxID=1442371 RepID=A0A0D2K7A2_9EURO|nr:uncharacterized protein Z520_05505 [Fonsecaea multimorphosa CBS 102226]KIX99044.1 hypothetical protein Z520_05505 [Fonsecaea multimorphosa CBS 102226]OAL25309.1 hypothetical protein AYO22_05186 [Fonsecaea multimorphosa]
MAFGRSGDPSQGNSSAATRDLAIKGWTNSKLASTPDQGVASLLVFLRKKSGDRQILSNKVVGRANNVLIITVYENDKDRFYHLNNFQWAGSTLIVEDSKPPPNSINRFQQNQAHDRSQNHLPSAQQSQPPRSTFGQNGTTPHGRHQPPSGPRGGGNAHYNQPRNNPRFGAQDNNRNDPLTNEVENTMISVLRKRYDPSLKLLSLNALGADEELLQIPGILGSDPAKVFEAIFTICKTKIFETPSKRDESVQSITLSNNGFESVEQIMSLSRTFPRLRNLDLGHNKFASMDSLKFWKNQFRDLEHLILQGNPVNDLPETLSTLRQWYPNLKLFNNLPVADNQSTAPNAQPPVPAQAVPVAAGRLPHPEIPADSLFGVPQADKPAEILEREKMGLQFSFETKLRLAAVEECLAANNWDYALAMKNFMDLKAQGAIPAEKFIPGV